MKVVFLPGAEADIKELRHYIEKNFGPQEWKRTYRQIKDTVRDIRDFPQSGAIPDELENLGIRQFRQRVTGMNRLIYEVRKQVVYIHIVCDTHRSMRTLLTRRLLGTLE